MNEKKSDAVLALEAVVKDIETDERLLHTEKSRIDDRLSTLFIIRGKVEKRISDLTPKAPIAICAERAEREKR